MSNDYKNDKERLIINENCSKYESYIRLQYNLLLKYKETIVGNAGSNNNLRNIEDISDRLINIENLISNERK